MPETVRIVGLTIFDAWVRRDVGRVFAQMFDAALASWVGAPPALCIFSETCGNALALEHNGDLYSCDHFVEPKYLLGNITWLPRKRSCKKRLPKRDAMIPAHVVAGANSSIATGDSNVPY